MAADPTLGKQLPETQPLPRDSGAGSTGSATATEPAPSCPPEVGSPDLPAPGQQLDDFVLLRVLGRGSFGTVFLAQQLSLDRQVALKVTTDPGHEAQTLARLEHDHIVQVFSEQTVHHRGRDLRLLCMRYEPGTTLEQVIRSLRQGDRGSWSGRAVLEAIDRLSTHPAPLHLAALRDRELLAAADFIQAVCWIGARLAEALDYAHGQGRVHRDIKPANILMNRYGRPLLADFNLSVNAQRLGDTIPFGGTLAYMAPEHLDAFNPAEATAAEAVDRRSDVYSLGMVLFELLTGRRPFAGTLAGADPCQALRALAAARRAGVPSPRRHHPAVPEVLDRVLRRCLEPQPDRRYATAAELAQALEGCRALRRIERELPPPGPLVRRALRRPFAWLVVLTLLPHLLGSLVNIPYNQLQIVSSLGEAQQLVFVLLVTAYNAVAYPVCLAVLACLIGPALRTWRALTQGRVDDPAQVTAVRRRVLTWPRWAVGVSCAGWLPGGVVFPLAISLLAGPIRLDVFGHFLVSFTLSGLIALTYSYFAVQVVALRVLYPRLWVDARDLPQRVAEELGSRAPRLGLFQLLAGTVPLAGALLLVSLGPDPSGDYMFRLLATGLILLGLAGFGLAVAANRLLARTLAVLTG
jgi:serine/threonine protein kinase